MPTITNAPGKASFAGFSMEVFDKFIKINDQISLIYPEGSINMRTKLSSNLFSSYQNIKRNVNLRDHENPTGYNLLKTTDVRGKSFNPLSPC